MITLLEYVWIDAFEKTRSKTKIVFDKKILEPSDCPEWTFDGSSTGQAEGWHSDIILKPVALFKDPFRKLDNAFLVLCETFNKEGTIHATNNRIRCVEISKLTTVFDPWFGIEQEYVIYDKNNKPYMWLNDEEPGFGKQGPYYCSAGGNTAFGRNIVEDHLLLCIYCGIKICGVNAEVMPSQWEFQIGPLDPISVCDQLWISRYILDRVCEQYNCWANYDPKPKKGWNGSGCHTNFSTNIMRQENGYDHIIQACEKLRCKHLEHICVYGKDNEKRLTGNHETSNINDFSYGVSHRGCSIRIPLLVVKENKGYLEDRRPASNMDPYLVVGKLLETVCLSQ
ncbi:glutamine synthetase [Catovirus CTV1]|uniref:glutamine synthetase n=1 Tax=Catovirus CTV1 TaxID=1977631 RepID=A0A1V0SAX1_9VIRU|nr:glutamine synthetase [Catovirus CTV1]